MRGIPSGAPVIGASDGGTVIAERIAAVYDPTIVGEALGRNHHIAFFAIEGALAPRTRAAIAALVESAFGVDRHSARVSLTMESLSLAFDPQRVAFGAMQRILDGKMAALRLSLLPMRIMDEPAMARS